MEDNVLTFSEDEIDMINYIKDVRDVVFSDEYDEANFAALDELLKARHEGHAAALTSYNDDTDYKYKLRNPTRDKIGSLAYRVRNKGQSNRLKKVIKAGEKRLAAMDKAYKLGNKEGKLVNKFGGILNKHIQGK